MKEDNGVW